MRLAVLVLTMLIAIPSFFCFNVKAHEDLTFGSWTWGNPAPRHLLATHVTLLRSNKILVVGGSSFNQFYSWGVEDTRFYDIATGVWSGPLASPAPYGPLYDAFCSGHAHDNTGGVIFQGGLRGYGDLNFHGIGNSARFDPVNGVFAQISGGVPHWYPTLVAGVNDMFNFPGTDKDGGNEIQKLSYGETLWSSTGVRILTTTYPRVTLLPNGKLFVASPDENRKNHFLDPDTNEVTLAGTDFVPESEPGGIHVGSRGTGVLLPLVPNLGSYPEMRFALINGVSAWVKDLGQLTPTWQEMGERPQELRPKERNFGNSTLLPTGQIFVSGGVSGSGPMEWKDDLAIRKPEVYDPETNTWISTTEAKVARNYHGVALLLPDGRVWTGGTSQDAKPSDCKEPNCEGVDDENTEERVEIFTPWYVGRADRPVVSACPETMVADGRSYEISIGGAQGLNVGRVVLMRPGSVTHAFDGDQRLIQLDIVTKTSSSVTVKSPYTSAAAPPGDYMVFALRSISNTGFKRWVPSVAGWTRIATPNRPVGAPIFRKMGTPVWQQLDNNPKTVSMAAAGADHELNFYQLRNDGSIWRFTGGPCANNSCAGWQRLDRNPKTAAIVAAGSQLYQLQNDGWILRYTGIPCNGDVCDGWQRLDRNAKTVAIAAAGNQLYQLHNDGQIWRYTGSPCAGDSCTGWERLDSSPDTVAIAAGGKDLYQMHYDGGILRYTGTPCSGASCLGWQLLSNNPKTIAFSAATDQLYQLTNNGVTWHFTGSVCSGNACPGWERLSVNLKTVGLSALGDDLFQLHNDGEIWRFFSHSWQRVDSDARTGMIVTSDPPMMGGGDTVYKLHTDPIYQMHDDGKIWRYTRKECEGDSCPGWELLDNNTTTKQIVVAGAQVFQRRENGSIWRYTGTPCSGPSCGGWQQLDNNSNTKIIAAAGIQLFKLQKDGKIWRYNGTPCSGDNCPGWELVDNNPKTVTITVAPTGLFQLRNDGLILKYTGAPCSGNACPGWQVLYATPNVRDILASGSQLFRIQTNGSIFRFIGAPCSGISCPGWEQLDNNLQTKALTAGANQLYQVRCDGGIWRYLGTPCNAISCPGWEQLDNNSHTREILASGNHLYQRHDNGRIFRYLGQPCAGGSCLGWRMLDNNSRTARIAVGGFN